VRRTTLIGTGGVLLACAVLLFSLIQLGADADGMYGRGAGRAAVRAVTDKGVVFSSRVTDLGQVLYDDELAAEEAAAQVRSRLVGFGGGAGRVGAGRARAGVSSTHTSLCWPTVCAGVRLPMRGGGWGECTHILGPGDWEGGMWGGAPTSTTFVWHHPRMDGVRCMRPCGPPNEECAPLVWLQGNVPGYCLDRYYKAVAGGKLCPSDFK
jgi:hypothetical protein